MIKQMQRRFIQIALLASLSVIALLLVGVNALNIWQGIQDLDQETHFLLERSVTESSGGGARERRQPPSPSGLNLADLWSDRTSEGPLAPYFYVRTDPEGRVIKSDFTHVEGMTLSQVEEWLPANQPSSSRGWMGSYRYRYQSTSDGQLDWLFVEGGRQMQAMGRLAFISLGVWMGSSVFIYLLLRFLSAKAMQPLIRNIERQREFISNASHELKTPLAVLSTNHDVLAMMGQDNEWTQSNRRQITRLNQLVNQMLQLARYDEGALTLNPVETDLIPLLQEQVQSLASWQEMEGIELNLSLPESLVRQVDLASFNQILQILLENAFQYHQVGSPIAITWLAEQEAFCFQNTCTSMSQDQLDRIFERFYRIDGSRHRKYGGSGMGLSIAQALAQQNRWDLTARLLAPDCLAFYLQMPQVKQSNLK